MGTGYNIGEFAKTLKINKETIRYYEKIGLLNEPKRDTNGYRKYTKEDIERLRCILISKEYGFSLKEIKSLLSKLFDEIAGCDLREIKRIIEDKIKEIDRKSEELSRMKKMFVKINDSILSEQEDICTKLEFYLNI
ncbi:MerR family transcriptional regulator [Clostridium sp. CF012]|uniref:MerR family transcriptional regulator n=1 Tax=Clostridium sp. CF012 TaxID=2843319 RepID=UPI001C0C34E5|nr:MerR family transcriptional regulator [Clostridium sp. CF012]MBU3144019.1 MerR family transcriptional regulator [Clostridium sp. CF012]